MLSPPFMITGLVILIVIVIVVTSVLFVTSLLTVYGYYVLKKLGKT